jgi:Uma2 family endonuclease
MAEPAPNSRMTADEFLAWAMEQPTGRYELFHGEVVAMAPERARHVRAKARAWRALDEAARGLGPQCEALADGMVVRIDETTIFEPDASLRCGDRLDGAATEFSDPVVVVEVLSPATRGVDTGGKFAAYFRLPSVRHYLIVDAEKRTVVHHARGDDGRILSTIATEGALALDPPGLAVVVADLFPPEDEAREVD